MLEQLSLDMGWQKYYISYAMKEPFLRSSLKAYGTRDKREFERYPIEAPVKVQYPGDLKASAELLLRSVNISAGGLFLSDNHPDIQGKKLTLEIELPLDKGGDDETMVVIKTTGTIVRTGPDGVAIRFNDNLDICLQPSSSSKLKE